MYEHLKVLFGNNLKRIRTVKNFSQESLASKSGLHRTYVGSVERGERNVSLVNMKRLAEALGVSIKDLIPDDEEIKEN